ncbi:DUF499 domain-containing protein [Nocardia amamiensis]|uniref:DUF499 domain-containing protein n=1 Tax=Nocardia amamiensis TaxID=404578 RepID=UPI00082EB5A2|nr:DUF499 domain-containing protein [Nocardia amamiensis]
MAQTHQQRVGKGFELLAEGLEPVVERLMQKAAPAGVDWLDHFIGTGMKLSKSDPYLLLKAIVKRKEVFKELLGPSGDRYAAELFEARNQWAHNEKFDYSFADRILDSAERLLRLVGAVGQADAVLEQREEHRIQVENKRALDRTRRSASAGVVVTAEKLGSWREVMVPHRDVQEGNYARAEFAADLHEVAAGRAKNEEYSDPIQFFRRTYLTEGLKELLCNAARRIAGQGNAEPAFNLQTNFGGGKTHSMLAVWHLYTPGLTVHDFPQSVQDMLGDVPIVPGVRRAAIVGNRIETAKPATEDGRPGIKTLWGELAWQLGGHEAYAIVAESDRASIPSGASLRQLLEATAPCVILIDEWVAYARLLRGGSDLPGGTFDNQFTFAQTLAETAKSVPGVMLILSIPASYDPKDRSTFANDSEVGGVHGQEALEGLENAIGRIAKHWRPATPDESFEIVRRRLFEDSTPQALRDRDFIAKSLVKFYRTHDREFPREVRETAYEDEIKRAYPIHPELFRRLYDDWSTLDRFQKTRGVLRLMSAVIFRLWQSEDPAPIIMPGSIPLGDEYVLGEVTHYLSDAWKVVIEADVDAPTSSPERIDAGRTAFGQRRLTRRLARAAFLASAARTGPQRKGVESKRIWLGTALPGDIVGNFASAIHLLSDEALYFHADGSTYWYDTQQSVNRLARERADDYRSHPEDVYSEIVRRIKERDFRKNGPFHGVFPAPRDSADIQDHPNLRLVIVHPRHAYSSQTRKNSAHEFAMNALGSRGNSPRENQNMLVFAVAERELLGYLMDSVRDYLAWNSIVQEDDLPLPADQTAMASRRRSRADDTVWLRLTQAYNSVYYPTWDKTHGRIGLGAATLDDETPDIPTRVGAKLTALDQLRTVIAPQLLVNDLRTSLMKVWEPGHIRFDELWRYYRKFPYLVRLVDRTVLEQGLAQAFNEIVGDIIGFALASDYDDTTGRYLDLVIPGTDIAPGPITGRTLIVNIERAKAQREQEERTQASADSSTTEGTDTGTDRSSTENPSTKPERRTTPSSSKPEVTNARFWGTYNVNPDRFARELNRLSQDLLALLAAPEGAELEITVNIEARRDGGFSSDTVMKVTENLRHLKVNGRFEDR